MLCKPSTSRIRVDIVAKRGQNHKRSEPCVQDWIDRQLDLFSHTGIVALLHHARFDLPCSVSQSSKLGLFVRIAQEDPRECAESTKQKPWIRQRSRYAGYKS